MTDLSSKLKIRNLSESDEGTYVCEGHNAFGTQQVVFHVTVLGTKLLYYLVTQSLISLF